MSFRQFNPALKKAYEDDPPPYEADLPKSSNPTNAPAQELRLVHVPQESWLKRAARLSNQDNSSYRPPMVFRARTISLGHPQTQKFEKLETNGHTTIMYKGHEYLVPVVLECLEAYVLVWDWEKEPYDSNGRYLLWYSPKWEMLLVFACSEFDVRENEQLVRYRIKLVYEDIGNEFDKDDEANHDRFDAWFTGKMVEAATVFRQDLVDSEVL